MFPEQYDLDRFADDGNMLDTPIQTASHTMRDGFLQLPRAASRIHRQHRIAIHAFVLAAIGISIAVDAHPAADLLFFTLSVLTELSA